MKTRTHSFSQGATLPTSSRNAASSRLHIAHTACSAQIVISNANNLGIPVKCRCAILPLEMRHAARKGERERWWGLWHKHHVGPQLHYGRRQRRNVA